MGIFPGFGAWISQNTQQPRKSQNVESKKVREMKSHEDRDDTKEQLKLWREAEKKKQWREPSPKVTKVRSNQLTITKHLIFFCLYKSKKLALKCLFIFSCVLKMEVVNELEWGYCHMKMDFELGLPPQAAKEMLTNPNNRSFTRIIKHHENGKSRTADKVLAWKFLRWSRTILIGVRVPKIADRKSIVVRNVSLFLTRNNDVFVQLLELLMVGRYVMT